MKRLVAVCLVLILVLSVSSSVLGSNQAETINTVVYSQIDISSAATGKFWVDPTVTSELNGSHYSGPGWGEESGYIGDFTAAMGGLSYSVKAAKYPLNIISDASDAIPDNAVMTDENTITSSSSVSYSLPQKTATADAKEVISLGASTTYSKTLNLQTKADKIYFLVAAAFGRNMTFSAEPLYSNGAYTQEAETFTVLGSNTTDDPAEVCLIESRETVNATSKNFATNSTDGVFGGKLVLHEFCLDIENTDTELSGIKFTAINTNEDGRIGSFAIVSVTVASDWSDEIANTEALIEDAVANTSDIDKVMAAINAVNEIKSAGLDVNSLIKNIAQFNEFFSQKSVLVPQISCTDLSGTPLYDIAADSEFNICFSATNGSDKDELLNILTAVYSKNNTLIDVKITSVTVSSNTLSEKITVPSSIPKCDFETAKIMVWDKNLAPLAKKELTRKNYIVNIENSANGKFYVNSDNPEELLISTYDNAENSFGLYDFSWNNASINNKTAATYPLRDTNGNSLTDGYGILKTKSGITYKMPEKKDGILNKEAISLNYHYCRTIDVDIKDGLYSKVNFIAASATDSTQLSFKATIHYTDGSMETFDNIPLYGYNETSQSGFISQLSKKAALNGTDLNNTVGGYVQLALFEYSFDIPYHKTADSISFTVLPHPRESHNGTSFMVAAITMERADVTELLTFTENKIKSSTHPESENTAIMAIISQLESYGIKKSDINGADTLDNEDSKRKVYVSTDGDDDNGKGTFNSPFAGIPKACEYITQNSDYIGEWEIILREGRYEITDTINLTPDNLNSYSSITILPYENEQVILSGGTKINMEQSVPVTDETILSRIKSSAHGKIIEIDLTKQGINNIIHPSSASFGQQRGSVSRLIVNGEPATPARWPDNGYAIIESCINNGNDSNGLSFTAKDVTSANISNWNSASDALLNGFFSDSDWRYDILDFESVDVDSKIITTAINPSVKIGNMAYPRRFYIENLLEELDSPGEWYINKSTNILYLYPITETDEVYITTLSENMINVSNLHNIIFENITFDGGAGNCIRFENSYNCKVKNCIIKNFSDKAISMSECTNTGIEGCDITHIGATGVSVYGGVTYAYAPTNMYVRDCIIEHFGEYSVNGSASGIITNQTIGVSIEHNKIANGPYIAIHMDDCINNSVEYNEIFNVQTEYSDAGAIYSGKSFISQGNSIKYNYIHDLIPYSDNLNGYLVGIYMDDLNSGFDIYGNIIQKVPIGIMLGGGKNLTVCNNIIMDSSGISANSTINADTRGLTWSASTSTELSKEVINYANRNPNYRKKFPHTLEKYYSTDFCGYPTNNTISNNFYYNHMGDSIYSQYKDSTYVNAYSGNYTYGSDWLDKYYYGSPFIDETNGDLREKENSVIQNRIPEFISIPFEHIGLSTKR